MARRADMRIYDIIRKKRDGEKLFKEEIEYFIKYYVSGEITDYQASALVMAMFINGLDDRETHDLTIAMVDSGDKLDLSAIKGVKLDKHSTGGVGDKTTLVLLPMVAACGGVIAKLSGRGLGHTGGTIDKLESIPGFFTGVSDNDFIAFANKSGLVVSGQTKNLVPADKKLYALRDVTATVDNIPLIASSIMSKKLSSGADAIMLDVKYGDGAFMKTREEAEKLASAMVLIGNEAGKKTAAAITSNDEPLGYAVGNSVEVIEVIKTLKGNGPPDLLELCLELGAGMLAMAGLIKDHDAAKQKLLSSIKDKSALNKFKEMIKNQGGNPDITEDNSLFKKSRYTLSVVSGQSGYIKRIKAQTIGAAAGLCGAGREKKEDSIDFSAGIVLQYKISDYVNRGDVLATIYSDFEDRLYSARDMLLSAYEFSENAVQKPDLLYKIL